MVDYDIVMKERTLCIVLLDLIGSTAFVQRYGAAASARHFQHHDRLARSLIYKYEGREIDRSDGFLCSFERVIDAVNFALKYQATIPKKIGLGCRIGIHWGKIVEVQQDDVFVAANAKRIELEGLSKNVAARTMSLCRAGQVLLTKEAIRIVKHRTNQHTPKGTRYVCVGLYRFKGVRAPMEIYAVGETLQSLQPPAGNDKVKRLGGPKYIKSRARDRKLTEWFWWGVYRLSVVMTLMYLHIFYFIMTHDVMRLLLGVPKMTWFSEYVLPIVNFLKKIRDLL